MSLDPGYLAKLQKYHNEKTATDVVDIHTQCSGAGLKRKAVDESLDGHDNDSILVEKSVVCINVINEDEDDEHYEGNKENMETDRNGNAPTAAKIGNRRRSTRNTNRPVQHTYTNRNPKSKKTKIDTDTTEIENVSNSKPKGPKVPKNKNSTGKNQNTAAKKNRNRYATIQMPQLNESTQQQPEQNQPLPNLEQAQLTASAPAGSGNDTGEEQLYWSTKCALTKELFKFFKLGQSNPNPDPNSKNIPIICKHCDPGCAKKSVVKGNNSNLKSHVQKVRRR